MQFTLCLLGLLLLPQIVFAQGDPLPSLKEISLIVDQWSTTRKEIVLPKVMRENNVDMWIMSMREYGEDTVFWSFKRATQFAARRRTIYVCYDDGDKVTVYDLVNNEDIIWDDLYSLVSSLNPSAIALNIDDTFSWSDGLHAGEREVLEVALREFTSRIVRRPRIGLDYVTIRLPEMLPYFQSMMQTIHWLISRAMSSEVITPGVTTTDDVTWWFRENFQALNYTTWFQPSFGLAREGKDWTIGVIQKGDLIWCDVGIVAFGLHTDTQHVGYVLKDGEVDAPQGFKDGLAQANQMQDILMTELQVGLTGNQILESSKKEMARFDITGRVYCHPVGDWGHSAGTLIGMTNMQDGVPGRGDVPVIPDSWYSIELEATVAVNEWNGQLVSFRQEEDMYIDSNGNNFWVIGRQSQLHIVAPVVSADCSYSPSLYHHLGIHIFLISFAIAYFAWLFFPRAQTHKV